MRGPNVVYVGNLPSDIKEREIQELFDKVRGRKDSSSRHLGLSAAVPDCRPSLSSAQFGSIRAIDIKIPPRPPPFAFVEFDDPR